VAAILFPLSLMLRLRAGKTRRLVFIGVQIFSLVIFFLQSPLGFSNTAAVEIFLRALTNLLPLAALLNLITLPSGTGGFAPMITLALGTTALSLVFVIPRFVRQLAAVDRRVAAARALPAAPHRSLPA
jgi:hypothetical protein